MTAPVLPDGTPVPWSTPAAPPAVQQGAAPLRGLSEEERAEVEEISALRAGDGHVDRLLEIIDRLTGAEARTGTEEP